MAVWALVLLLALPSRAAPPLEFRVFSLGAGPLRLGAGEAAQLSRLPPLVEYLVQRVQGLLSVRLPPGLPGAVLSPEPEPPGTYRLQIPLDDDVP